MSATDPKRTVEISRRSIGSMTLRKKFSLAFALVPLIVGVPSYLLREHFGLSPNSGYLENVDVQWIVLSALINTPLFGLAAHIAWPLFGNCRDNLFYKSFIGNTVFGLLLPIAAILMVLIPTASILAGLRYVGITPLDYPAVSIPVFMLVPVWGSYFHMMIAGGILGIVFGWRKGLSEVLG